MQNNLTRAKKCTKIGLEGVKEIFSNDKSGIDKIRGKVSQIWLEKCFLSPKSLHVLAINLKLDLEWSKPWKNIVVEKISHSSLQIMVKLGKL